MDKYDVYLFDLDGTLLDSIDLILRAYRHTAVAHLGESPPDDVWLRGLGTPLRAQLRDVTEDAELIETMVVTYREYHQAHHDQSVKLYPGVLTILETLRWRGARLGVVTSKLRYGAEKGLALTGLLDHFEAIVTADEVANPKPHPEPVLTALDRLRGDAARAVFVGDSPHDIAAGRAAGVATAGVLWGPFAHDTLRSAAPDYLVNEPQELLAL